MKAGVRAVFSNGVAERAKPETVSATPVKAWVSKLVLLIYIGIIQFYDLIFSTKHIQNSIRWLDSRLRVCCQTLGNALYLGNRY